MSFDLVESSFSFKCSSSLCLPLALNIFDYVFALAKEVFFVSLRFTSIFKMVFNFWLEKQLEDWPAKLFADNESLNVYRTGRNFNLDD